MNDDDIVGGLFPENAAPETTDKEPDIAKLKRMFNEAASAQEEARKLAQKSRDYYDGEQIDAATKGILHKRGQSAGAWNQIRRSVDGVLGLISQSASDPEATARNDNGDEAATVVTKVLRYLSDKTDLEETKRILSKSFVVGGTCAVIVEVDHTGDARTVPIEYDEFYYDPYSKRPDFSDAQYLIQAKWLDLKTAQRMWPDKASSITAPSNSGFGIFDPSDNGEFTNAWWDGQRKRLMVVNIYYIDPETGVWNYAILCHSTIFEYGESGFLDDNDHPTCPILGLSYEMDRQGVRYGIVKDMIPLQDKVNGLDSRTLHLAVSTQVQITDDSALPTDRDTARTEAARADGVIPKGYSKIETTDLFQGATLKLNQYVQAIKDMSPSPSVLGRAEGANQSGRARQIAAASGFTEMATAFARLERLEERIYEQMWFRARQFMTAPKMLRVTDDTGAKESLMLNYPIQHPMTVHQPIIGADGKPVIDPHTGQPAMHPVVQQQTVGVQNQLAQMSVEITITTVRQAVSLRQEAIDAMLEWAAKTGTSILAPEFEFVIQMSNIPDKAEILSEYQRLRGAASQQQQAGQEQQQQAAQQAQALQAQSVQAKTAKDNAQAQRDTTMAQKHAIEAHEQAFDLSVKELALKQATQGASPEMYAALNPLNQPPV
jgi:hypothetical protein